MFKELFTISVLLFFCSSLLNVVLSTLKTILTVKSSKQVATLINCINYTINTVIIKQIAECEVWIAAIITFLTNLIGVYFALWIVEKFKKDKLWKISVTYKDIGILYSVVNRLDDKNISFLYTSIYYSKMKKGGRLEIFAKNKEESKIAKEILETTKCKYDVIEVTKTEL